MMALFLPSGHACCYHRNGAIHMLCDPHGGMLMDEVHVHGVGRRREEEGRGVEEEGVRRDGGGGGGGGGGGSK